MAEHKPLKAGSTGAEKMGASDTLPVANIPNLTAAKITDFEEAAQDAAGALLADSDTIDVTYNDAGNAESAAVKMQMSITSDSSGVKLSGDSATPGNSKLYGTDGSGTKGWYDQPTSGSETYTAGENIAARDLVYVSASGTVMKADANVASKKAVGFAPSAISNGATGSIIFNDGKITGYTGLTANEVYFLSNATPGGVALYSALTFASGDIEQPIGIAESTTVIRFSAGPTILN